MLWILQRSTPLDAQKREARWFTLDSDILLGAVANSEYVAIVGRERRCRFRCCHRCARRPSCYLLP
jgi:hypothetical protein